MSCVLVPMVEAIATTVAKKVIQKREHNTDCSHKSVLISEKLGLLNKMLWGGSGLLAFEHIWHGEIVPFFPFLTAAQSPGGTIEMLHEMATSGTGMALVVTAVWGVMVALEFKRSFHSKEENAL